MGKNIKKDSGAEIAKVGAVLVLKSSQQLIQEVNAELLADDPEDAEAIISKNKVVVNE